MLSFLFYFLSALLIYSAVLVILNRNPVYSVLSLIFSFFVSSFLFVIMGAELVAMLIVIVYVGAVAVLFLFVVMMLDIDYSQLRARLIKHYVIGLLCSLLCFAGVIAIIKNSNTNSAVVEHKIPDNFDNVTAIGRLLYTEYAYLFHLSSVLLLVAIVGALVLTLRERLGVHRQNISEQVNRSSAVKLVNPERSKGVEWKD